MNIHMQANKQTCSEQQCRKVVSLPLYYHSTQTFFKVTIPILIFSNQCNHDTLHCPFNYNTLYTFTQMNSTNSNVEAAKTTIKTEWKERKKG